MSPPRFSRSIDTKRLPPSGASPDSKVAGLRWTSKRVFTPMILASLLVSCGTTHDAECPRVNTTAPPVEAAPPNVPPAPVIPSTSTALYAELPGRFLVLFRGGQSIPLEGGESVIVSLANGLTRQHDVQLVIIRAHTETDNSGPGIALLRARYVQQRLVFLGVDPRLLVLQPVEKETFEPDGIDPHIGSVDFLFVRVVPESNLVTTPFL